MASWSQIENSPRFSSLSPEGKRKARDAFFNQYIAPQAPPEAVETAYQKWMNDRAELYPSATLGDFTVEQTVPEQGLLSRAGATLSGAGEGFVDRTQAQMGGLLAAAGGGLRAAYDSTVGSALNIAGTTAGRPDLQQQAQAVSGFAGGIEEMGTDIARAELAESQRARQSALDRGANELGLDILGALGDVGVQVASTLATRSPGVGASVAAGQVFGPEYARNLEEGMSKEDAAKRALARSGVEVGTTVPALGIVNRLFGRQAGDVVTDVVERVAGTRAGRIALGAAAEGAQEATAGVVGDAVDYTLGYTDSPIGDLGENLREGGMGAVVGGVIGAMTPGRARRSVTLPVPEANVAADLTAQVQQSAGVKLPEAVNIAEAGDRAVAAQTAPVAQAAAERRSAKPRARLNLETGRIEPILDTVEETTAPAPEEFAQNLETFRGRVRPPITDPNAQRRVDEGRLEQEVAKQLPEVTDAIYIKGVLAQARTDGIKPTPEWIKDQVGLAKAKKQKALSVVDTAEGSSVVGEPTDSPFTTRDEFINELKTELGSDFNAIEGLLTSGRLAIQSSQEIPASVTKNRAVYGFYDNTTGKAGLVWNNIPKGQARPVLFHEVGAHGGIQQNQPIFKKALGDITKLVEKNNEVAVFARDAVVQNNEARLARGEEALTPEQAEREMVAYFLQGAAGRKLPRGARLAYEKVKASIKQFLVEKGWLTDKIKLTEADIYHIANGMIQSGGVLGERTATEGTDLAEGGFISNNASGESAASLEAQSRLAQERDSGQTRFKVQTDGTVVPLLTVDGVDTSARPGEIIVQRGIGNTPFTILDQSNLSNEQAQALVNRLDQEGRFVVGDDVETPMGEYTINPDDYADGDLDFSETYKQRQQQQSASHYTDTTLAQKLAKKVFTWEGSIDTATAKAQEALTLQKAGLGVAEREIDKRGKKIRSLIRKHNLDNATQMAGVDAILRGEEAPNLDRRVRAEAVRIRNIVDQGQTEVLAELAGSGQDPRATPEMLEKIYNSIGSYLSRSYLRTYYKPGGLARALGRGKDGSLWKNHVKKQDPQLYNDLIRFVDDNLVVPSDLSRANNWQLQNLASQHGVSLVGRDLDAIQERIVAAKDNPERVAALQEQMAEAQASLRQELGGIRGKYASAEAMRDAIIEDLSSFGSDSNLKMVKSAARDEGILEKRTDVPEVIRKWWGEVQDPITVAAITFDRLGTLAAETRLLNTIYQDGLGNYVFDETAPAPDGNVVALNNKSLGVLDGKLVRPEMAKFLETQLGLKELTKVDGWQEAATTLIKWAAVMPGGASKAMATVASWPTLAMNVQSNAILSLADLMVMGTVARVTPSAKYKDFTPLKMAWYTINDSFNTISNPEQVRALVESGILRDGVTLGQLRSEVRKLQRNLAVDAAPTTTKRRGRRVASVVEDAGDLAADFYQLSDNIPRTVNFAVNLANLEAAYPNLNRKEVWDMAADRSRNMTPTFGRATPLAKVPSKIMGNFATWASEVVRTYSWRFRYGLTDLAEGIKTGNVPLIRYGSAQLLATGASLAANSFAIQAMFGMMFSTGDEEEDKQRSEDSLTLTSEFLQDKNLVPVEVDRDNKRIYVVNTTRNDPSAPIQESINRATRQGAGSVFEYGRDTLFGPGMWLQGAWKGLSGEDRWGRQLTPRQRVQGALEPFVPGTIKAIVRGTTQYNQGSSGSLQSWRAAGVPVEEIDVPRSVTTKAFAYNDAVKENWEGTRRQLQDARPMTEAQFNSIYADYIQTERELFSDLSEVGNAAIRTVGMTPSEVNSIFKEAGVGNNSSRGRILRNDYAPQQRELDFLDNAMESALRKNVRDAEYQARVRADFNQRKRWLRRAQANRSEWSKLLED